jgi:hypothetical protein
MNRFLLTLFIVQAGFCFAQTPTIPSSNLQFTNVRCNQLDVSWTNGNGSQRVVFVRENRALKHTPVQNEFYSANSKFGLGEAIQSDSDFCVYKGTGNSFTLTGLKKNTNYFIAVFEFNNQVAQYNYLTSTFPQKDTLTQTITAQFTIKPRAQCLNGNLFEFKNSSSSNHPLTYAWDFGDTEKSTDSNTTHSYKTYGIYKVSLKASNVGCTETVQVEDTVWPQPIPAFSLDPLIPGNDSIQCLINNQFTIKNKTTWPEIGTFKSSVTYYWKTDNFIGNSYKASFNYQFSGTKIVKLIAETNFGCKDSISNIYVVKNGSINPTLVSISPRSMNFVGNSFQFKNSNDSAANHKWYIQKKGKYFFFDSSSNATWNYSFKDSGTFYVYLKAFDLVNGCSDLFKDSVIVLGKKLQSNKYAVPNIKVFPNPSHNGQFVLNNLDIPSQIKVFDLQGKEILELVTTDAEVKLNLNHIKSGIYILQISTENYNQTQRLIFN